MKRAIDIDELIRHNRALEAQFVEDGQRIEELQFELSSYEESDANLQKKVKELEARLQRIRELPQYICEFPDIGKLGGAYRKRDVDEIIQAELEKK